MRIRQQNRLFSNPNMFNLVLGCCLFLIIGCFVMDLGIPLRPKDSILNNVDVSLSSTKIIKKEKDPSSMLQQQEQIHSLGNIGGAKFVFVMGVEGTGHHFMQQQILLKSPSYHQVQQWGLLPNAIQAQDTLVQLWIHQCEESSSSSSSPLRIKQQDDTNEQHDHLVQILHDINQQIQQQQAKLSSPSPSTTTVMLNLLDKMVSYPMGGYCHRSGQHFTLDTLYDACEKVNVQCGHVIMWRNPYEVIHSSVKNRQFSSTAQQQILDLTQMLNVILEQMKSYPMNLEACIDFNDIPTIKKQTEKEASIVPISNNIPIWGELFGWQQQQQQYQSNSNYRDNNDRDSIMISFEQMMNELWHPSQRKYKVDYSNMISTRHEEELMNVFEEKMNHVATLCTEQLQQQQQQKRQNNIPFQ